MAHTSQNISPDEKAVFVSGPPGSGKTFAALQFCSGQKESLYFPFKNLDTAFALQVFCNAHTEIFGTCESWFDFFARLKAYGNKKHLLVFFDNAGERKDKEEFYASLNRFLESDCKITVVLLGWPWEAPPILCRKVEIRSFSMPQLADVCSLPDQTAAQLYCLTGAIPALLSLYDTELPFEENVRSFLRTDSVFYRLAASWMNESFRTPESYNTLLYAMANGYTRIGEIAKFSGFPKNKCDKYIKALIEHGFVRKVPGENGHTKYFPANTYFTLWYQCFLTAVPNPDGSFGEDVFNRLMQVFNGGLMSDFYKNMCDYWLEKNVNRNTSVYIDPKNTAYRNVEMEGVTFDFACQKGENIYAVFNTVPGEGLTIDLWRKIDDVTSKISPFYENEYYICTVNRVPESFWTLSKTYENVHIVSLKMLFATYKKEYNKIAHPRFVPPFV